MLLCMQVGLLIGKAGVGSRDLLLAVIRTPLRVRLHPQPQ